MHYTGPVIRPPHEANSILLEVTVGCTHNSCRFCTFYYDTPYRVAPKKQIENDLREAKLHYPNARRIYAVGGDPFTLRTAKLIDLAQMIRHHFPDINIGMYARVDSMYNKTVEDLKRLKKEGINDLVIGIESGDDAVLEKMDKGYTSQDIIRECKKLEEAGISYRVIFLGGLSGQGNGERNARNTAKVLNQLQPSHMYMTSVAVQPESLLYQDVLEGRFTEATEYERIEEMLMLVRQLINPIVLLGQSVANPVNFIASLPQDYEALTSMLETTMQRFTQTDEDSLRAYRERLVNI
ncbi:radical SAM protein [Vibrio mangrovi]|uniref:Oxygen-independent coproporphyrinogen-III oxidase 1 n=1 Tax=Vibrio mangrovi TaxID=474394 RepID=A0A1Y6IXJ5_9VIBR|nr:radical SAM protein [Vibrio mangrovi]MDW6002884.1 radical SAM protein [Vibrio mangrovi]SMS02374.1 Oxygen-independent coproporphyrinogen-III oxidase 1 [Vibrio mangrovi]